jgi:hypothetical protein
MKSIEAMRGEGLVYTHRRELRDPERPAGLRDPRVIDEAKPTIRPRRTPP